MKDKAKKDYAYVAPVPVTPTAVSTPYAAVSYSFDNTK